MQDELAEWHFSTAFHGLTDSVFVKLRGKVPNEDMGPPPKAEQARFGIEIWASHPWDPFGGP